MNTKELIDRIAAMPENAMRTKVAVRTDVSNLVSQITAALSRGEDVKLHGLGTIRVTKRTLPERERRNPRTGETFIAQPCSKILSRISLERNLKDTLNAALN